jgi:hypothetical protein
MSSPIAELSAVEERELDDLYVPLPGDCERCNQPTPSLLPTREAPDGEVIWVCAPCRSQDLAVQEEEEDAVERLRERWEGFNARADARTIRHRQLHGDS